jgi:hypothetical protein
MPDLVETPNGWVENAPTDCENCSLAWPFDGTPDRVQLGWSVGGGRTYRCCGCGHVTGSGARYRIGGAPDGEVGR